jgi:hypothetical protein
MEPFFGVYEDLKMGVFAKFKVDEFKFFND